MLIVQATGLEKAASVFENTATGTWRRGLMAYVGQLIRAQTQRRIRSEKTSPGGQRWAAWAASTASRRSGGQSLLVFTGKLVSTLFMKASDDTTVVGSPAPYSGFLQDGTDRMVAREFLGLSESNKSEVMLAVEAFVRSSLLP